MFTIKHDVNEGFSQFTKVYIASLLRSTVGTNVTFEAISPNSITFTFEDGPRSHLNNDKPAGYGSKNAVREVLQKSAA